MKFARIFSDFVENAEKRCNFSKFLDFNFDSIFKSIQFSNGLIFNFSIYFLIQLSLIRPPLRGRRGREQGDARRENTGVCREHDWSCAMFFRTLS